MTYLGLASSSGQILFDTGDNRLHQFGTLEGDIRGTIKNSVVSGIAGFNFLGTPASGMFLRFNGNNWEFNSDILSPHNLLSSTHIDTVPNSVTRGDLIVGSGLSSLWNRLPIGQGGFVLHSNGVDLSYTRLGQNTPFESGSLLFPSITFHEDLDTGLSNTSNDVISMSVGGTGLVVIDGPKNAAILDSAQIVRSRLVGANTTLLNRDFIVLVTAGGITINLPPSPITGRMIIIKDANGSASPMVSSRITISGNGNNIDGGSEVLITRVYGAFTLLYNGTQWNII